jgi:hypothetical protein
MNTSLRRASKACIEVRPFSRVAQSFLRTGGTITPSGLFTLQTESTYGLVGRAMVSLSPKVRTERMGLC